MVAYSFEDRHHAKILSGLKPFTLRKAGKKRHARIGEPVQFRAGRTGPVFAVGRCTLRATIVFTAESLQRVTTVSMTPEGDAVWRLLMAAEQGAYQAAEHREKLAAADGFESWADMVRWHAEQEGKGGGPLLWREVIGFGAVASLARAA